MGGSMFMFLISECYRFVSVESTQSPKRFENQIFSPADTVNFWEFCVLLRFELHVQATVGYVPDLIQSV